jgi:hypothetical protein
MNATDLSGWYFCRHPVFVDEMGTIDPGHELTWFHRLSESHSSMLRHALLAIFLSAAALALSTFDR